MSGEVDAIANGVQSTVAFVMLGISWERVQAAFSTRPPGRNIRLPTLLASNPVNYAKPNKLSSLEALAGGLYVMGFREQAHQLLSIFKWAPHFLTLNAQPLEAYAAATSEEQMIRLESEFF